MNQSEYRQKLASMSIEDLLKETETRLWLSTYANGDAVSEYGWMVDVLRQELSARNQTDAYLRLSRSVYETDGLYWSTSE